MVGVVKRPPGGPRGWPRLVARGRSWFAIAGAGLLVVSLSGSQPSVAQARPGTDDASPEEARLLEEIEESTGRRRELDRRVDELDGRIAGVSDELRTAESRLSAVDARQRGAEARLAENRRQLGEAEQAIRDQAIAAYTGERGVTHLAGMMFRAGDVGELATKRAYLRIVADTQADTISAYHGVRDKAQDLLTELTAAQAQAQRERDVVQQRRARLRDERNAQGALRREVDTEIANRNNLLDVIRARQAEFQAPVIALQQQSAAVAGTLQERQGAQTSPASSGARLSAPIPGAPVVSAYGGRIHPIYGDYRLHTGVDLDAASGAPIRAAGDGVVVSAGWLGGYGQATIIEHGGPLATLYAHQSQMLVSVGQRVTGGQVIGRVGCTGTCTGTHLHYEVRINGDPVNPAGYL